MPGAETDLDIKFPENRGVRSPRLMGYIDRQQQRFLQPFLAHPLRPGEILAGASIQGSVDLNSWIQLPNAPLMYGETCLWVVPIPTLGQDIIEMIVGTAEDIADKSDSPLPGSAIDMSNDPRSQQGHQSFGAQTVARPWAGEVGGNNTAADFTSAYIPYTSRSTWKVAYEHYDVDNVATPGGLDDDDLHDNPPTVENYIRSTTRSMVDLGLANLDPDPTTEVSWYSEMVERLYLLTQPELTYAEYLAAHGVDPRRSSGISQLFMRDHGRIVPAARQLFSAGGASQANRDADNPGLGSTFHGTGFLSPSPEEMAMWHDRRPSAHFSRVVDTYRSKPMFIDAPSVLLGTHVWWAVEMDNHQFGHLAMNRMTHPGHWGNSAFGDIDESDFLSTQSMYKMDGNTLITDGEEDDQTSGAFLMNLLNLYLHGDEALLSHGYDVPEDAYKPRIPGGIEPAGGEGDQYNSMNVKLSTQIHVVSDLVG